MHETHARQSFRTHTALALALALLALLCVLLAGCGGGGGTATPLGGSYAGRSFAATGLPLGALVGDLQLTTATAGRTVRGTLTVAPAPAQGALRRPAAGQTVPNGYNVSGTYDPTTGAVNLRGTFEYPAGTGHAFSITGTLPLPPTYAGTLTVVLDGVTYGPFTFGDNRVGTGGGTGGGTTGGGTTGGPVATSADITFSSVAGANADASPFQTTTLNGNFLKLTPSFQLTAFYEMPGAAGVTRQLIFEGPVTNGPVTAGTVFTYQPSQGEGEGVQNLFYVEKNAVGVETASWVSVGGQLRIDDVQPDGIRYTLLNVHMQPSPNPKGATGTFILSGPGALRVP